MYINWDDISSNIEVIKTFTTLCLQCCLRVGGMQSAWLVNKQVCGWQSYIVEPGVFAGHPVEIIEELRKHRNTWTHELRLGDKRQWVLSAEKYNTFITWIMDCHKPMQCWLLNVYRSQNVHQSCFSASLSLRQHLPPSSARYTPGKEICFLTAAHLFDYDKRCSYVPLPADHS